MIELHGWITIRETYKSFFEEEEQIDSVIKKIQEEINKMSWFKPKIEIKNGEYFMQFSSFSNRINPETSEIFEVFKLIGEIAEGSYGIIYLYNDEDTDGKENYFQVFSLARGMIKENLDEFLSPIIPTIEDRDSFDV